MNSVDALFHRDGSLYVPTGLTRGPWHPDAQHGGAPAALMASCAHHFDAAAGMAIVRMTVELMRPVPLAPLALAVEVERPGRKVQLLSLSMRAGDVEVARARILRLRTLPIDLPPNLSRDDAPPGPDSGASSLPGWRHTSDLQTFHRNAIEHRFVAGAFDRPGPSTDWIRLRVPVIDGEAIPPVARALAAADFGNGISWELDRNLGYSFVNPDLTVYLARPPIGEWVCLQARSRFDTNGIGFAESLLWDASGPIGRSVQSLLIDHTAPTTP